MASPLPGRPEQSNFHDGWFYPGEIASLDEDGYIFLRGRESDIIMRSGAKIYPAEVERVLIEHPDVAEAAVVGHREANNEEGVVAFVVARRSVLVGDLIAHCRARLTPHKVPQQIFFLQQLPTNTARKVDKSALAKSLDGGNAP
jgi:acyl-coenzyme A synthetase/AMP-(fatty) acid ligase